MVVFSLISKLEYTINRNCLRLFSDLISSMNLYKLAIGLRSTKTLYMFLKNNTNTNSMYLSS